MCLLTIQWGFSMKDIFCSNCGKRIEKYHHFCEFCGHKNIINPKNNQLLKKDDVNQIGSNIQTEITSKEYTYLMVSFLTFVIVPIFKFFRVITDSYSETANYANLLLDIFLPLIFLICFYQFTSRFNSQYNHYLTKNIVSKLGIVVGIEVFLLISYIFRNFIMDLFSSEFYFTTFNLVQISGSIVFLYISSEFVKWLKEYSTKFINFEEILLNGFFYFGILNCIAIFTLDLPIILYFLTHKVDFILFVIDNREFIYLIWGISSILGGLSVIFVLYQINSQFQSKSLIQQSSYDEIISDSYVTQQTELNQQKETKISSENRDAKTEAKKELLNLKNKLDKGIITENEYEAEIEKIFDTF